MKSIKHIDVSNKKVLIRVDFNVPLTKTQKIKDDFRIKAHLNTIKYLKEKNAKIILISHLGDPKKRDENFSLNPVASRLESLLSSKVKFVEEVNSKRVEELVENLKQGDVLLLENLRFYKGEKENSEEFASSIAEFADIFVQDAFSVCHRNHASIASLPKFLNSYTGLLLEKEINAIERAIKETQKPFVVLIGGAKIETKTAVLKNFLKKADAVLLGGEIANTILKCKGIYGDKKVEDKDILNALKGINFNHSKLIVPIDGVLYKKEYTRIAGIETIKEEEEVGDIGPETINYYKRIIKKARTIIWNGPLGKSEEEVFSKGTEEIANAIVNQKAYSVIGGGETIDFVNRKDIKGFSFISGGGGAMLDYISGKTLPGLEALNKKYEEN
jgi:phosphoglycerate kinase